MPSEPALSPHVQRSSLWWISALLLALMIASGLLPIHRPSPGFAALNTRADYVFGQPDFTSSAAPNPPSASSMNAPGGVAYDLNSIEGSVQQTEGMVFVSDTGNNRILGWNAVSAYENGDAPDWVIGQPDFNSNLPNNPALGGLSARTLNQPTGLTLLYYELYVADTGNNRVLRFEYPFSNGMAASLVLGQPDFTTNEAGIPRASSLNAPTDVATDAFTALFVADRGNNRVVGYEGDLSNGMDATLLMGQPDFGRKAVADPPNASSLKAPASVDFPPGSADQLYVADSGNNRVLVYNREPPDPIADRVFGQPNFTSNEAGPPSATSLNQPGGLGFDLFEQLYVADTGNNRVLLYRRPDESTRADEAFGQPDLSSRSERPPSAESLKAPLAVAPSADPVRDLVYIADSGNNRVLGYEQTRDDVRPIIFDPSRETLVAGSEGFELELLELGLNDSSIVRVNGQRRAWRFLGTTGSSTYIGVRITAADIAAPGMLTITAETFGGGVSEPVVIPVYAQTAGDTTADAVLGQPNLASAEALAPFPAADTLLYPSVTAVDPTSGRLFVADSEHFRVVSWPNAATFADGAEADLVIGQRDLDSAVPGNPLLGGQNVSARNLAYVFGLAVDGDGNLYVADSFNNRVLIYQAPLRNGEAATKVIGQPDFTSWEAGWPTSTETLNYPNGLAVDGAGNLYVADRDNHRVLFYTRPLETDTTADLVFGQGGDFTTARANKGGISARSLSKPSDVAVDGWGNLYVADRDNHRALVYRSPLATDTTADRVFGQGDDFTTGAPNKGGVTVDSLNEPRSLALDRTGVLYVSDTGNHRVLAYAERLTGDSGADLVFGQGGDFTTAVPNKGGLGANSLYVPFGVAVDPVGNLVVVDYENHRVLRYAMPLTSPLTLYLPGLQRR